MPESIVTEEMQAAVAADLEEKQAAKKDPAVRTLKREGRQQKLYVSDLYEFPVEFDLDGVYPTSYLAQPVGPITGFVDTQEFTIIEERLKGLLFDQPARDLEKGQTLKTVKGLKLSGDLIQIPYEKQINNTAGGDYSDAIGVQRQRRKGTIVFYDFETGMPVYCFTNNCWAAAMVPGLVEMFPEHLDVIGTGYCSRKHYQFSAPNEANGYRGMFSGGATTTQSRRTV
jgi:hypothetical protein